MSLYPASKESSGEDVSRENTVEYGIKVRETKGQKKLELKT